ncbi:MAG: glycosyltransferase family 2 protein [Caldilineaceae bacterium]
MNKPKVSVVIPAYNGGEYLAEAIQSVLDQSYPHFELIVVDDCSPAGASEIMARFSDPRLRFIVQSENLGAVAARKTGVDAATGEIIAFLDQDDLFHPEKLATHVAFLEAHPEIGVSYNSRFECNGDAKTIRSIWQPPTTMTLSDLVLGFPFAPSDTVVRRELAQRDELWDQSYVRTGAEKIFNGAEIIFGGRLALVGQKMADVGRTLNYRRYHPRRKFSDLAARCQAEQDCQELILSDSRCPAAVGALRHRAFTNIYLSWIYYAFTQGETAIGQSFVRKAIALTPTILQGEPSELVGYFVDNIANDSSLEIAETLTQSLAQLPPDLAITRTQLDWAIGRGYLIRAMQAMVWDRPEQGEAYLAQADQFDAQVDEAVVQSLTYQLFLYQEANGVEATENVLRRLAAHYPHLGRIQNRRWISGYFAVNRAFRRYQTGEFSAVPRQVVQAVTNHPQYLFNRGVIAILFRSLSSLQPRFGV